MENNTLAEARKAGTLNYCYEVLQITEPRLDIPTLNLVLKVMKKHDVDRVLLDRREKINKFGFSKNGISFTDEKRCRLLLNELLYVLGYHKLLYLCISPPSPELENVPMSEVNMRSLD